MADSQLIQFTASYLVSNLPALLEDNRFDSADILLWQISFLLSKFTPQEKYSNASPEIRASIFRLFDHKLTSVSAALQQFPEFLHLVTLLGGLDTWKPDTPYHTVKDNIRKQFV
jgi:hypothetical protein